MNLYDHSLHQNPINKEEKNGHRASFHSTCPAASNSGYPWSGLPGSELTPTDFAGLEARWIDQDLALSAQLRRVDSATGAAMVGRKGADYSGIAIPYILPGTNAVREYRLRRDHPEMEIDSQGRVKPRQKDLSPPGRGNMLYFAPGTTEAQLRDTALPLIITEGEFKTLALARLASWSNTERPRFLPVGVSGVYN